MDHWLLVERIENWEIDKREGFQKFGIPERRRVLAGQIQKGDLLIFYISSGISMFADIREATSTGTKQLPFGGDYDTAYPLSVSTRPYLILERNRWITIRSLVDKLSFTTGKKDWRQLMRVSLRRLQKSDALLIIKAMQAAQK